MSGSAPDDGPAREAWANVVLFGSVMGGVDKPAEGEPAPDPRPNRPTGSIDQGARGASIYNPREAWRQWLDERLRR